MNEQTSWPERVRTLLDRSVDDLDANTASRLNRARQRALATRRGGRASRLWQWSAGLAAGSALALALVLGLRAVPDPPAAARPAIALQAAALITDDEGDLVGGEDNLDLAQDLEFYAWLDTQDDDING